MTTPATRRPRAAVAIFVAIFLSVPRARAEDAEPAQEVVVRSVRVLEGPFDPRQGDAAIVGSAYFDLGVPERGYRVGATYGSFGQARLVGIAAPRDADDDTFVAFSLRRTSGFGDNRSGAS